MQISVIIPAHNEARFIQPCLESIRAAETKLGSPIEIVVCLNRCTDETESIAKHFGAVIAKNDAKNIAKIRNTAIRASSGDVVVTIDADSRMTSNMLFEIKRMISSGKYVGGGTLIKPERFSLGIFASSLVVLYYALIYGLKSAGLFWCTRQNFEAIGGFNESLITLEDLDFANRLALYGKTKGLRYGTIWRAAITTSCRKFDKYGDWYFFRNPGFVKALFNGHEKSANSFFYEPER